MLYDNHGRKINYLRLAVTDRCNLRCQYCMPEEGIDYVPRKDLLTFEEMYRLVSIMADLGVDKIRITGGEPFLRKGLIDFIASLKNIEKLKSIHITTNGTLMDAIIPRLKNLDIASVNLSLDTLDASRFKKITRRDGMAEVWSTLEQLIHHEIPTKINMVVMDGQNIEDIIPMIELTKSRHLGVRFLEEMPFNGSGTINTTPQWDFIRILKTIQSHYGEIEKLVDPENSTAFNYKVKEYKGHFGIIASYSRLFCGTCNRLRLTPQGTLKTCLYDDGVFNMRECMRNEATDSEIATAIQQAVSHRYVDGVEAEKARLVNKVSESMATIGG